MLVLTRLTQRSFALQPGHLLISPKLTLSVGSSISITLHAATQARRLLAFTAAGLPSSNESHPMDHDSNSIWTHLKADLTPSEDLMPLGRAQVPIPRPQPAPDF